MLHFQHHELNKRFELRLLILTPGGEKFSFVFQSGPTRLIWKPKGLHATFWPSCLHTNGLNFSPGFALNLELLPLPMHFHGLKMTPKREIAGKSAKSYVTWQHLYCSSRLCCLPRLFHRSDFLLPLGVLLEFDLISDLSIGDEAE